MNPSTALASVVIDELIRLGIRDVVLAPGSRSAPLALAVAAADAAELIRLHVRIDERSAGFLALGLAKISRTPVAVVVTSGSAVLNLSPALTEASYAGVPLVVLTADRPPELRGTSANQTIDQVKVYGDLVRRYAELGPAQSRPDAVRAWRGVVDQLVATSIDTHRPGPVHLNLAFRDPLVPHLVDTPPWDQPLGLIDLTGAQDRAIPAAVQDRRAALSLQEPLDELLREVADDLVDTPRGVVLVGDVSDATDAEDAATLAEACGWPLLSEPSGNAKRGPHALAHAALLLSDNDFIDQHRPDVVVTVGRVGLSRGTTSLLKAATVHIAVDPGRTGLDWPDPARTARVVLSAVPLPPEDVAGEDHPWLDDWLLSDARASTIVDDVLAANAAHLNGPEVARTLMAVAAPESLVFVAASRPVRDVEAFAGVRDDGPLVIGNRGTSGIDGLVSTAWGAALAHQDAGGTTAYALLGDLAFLHDSNGLVVGDDEPAPDVVYVVVDNDGGGIFGSLEQGAPEYAESFDRVFGTPHGVDLASMCRAMGVPGVHEVATRDELRTALAHATEVGSVHVIVADIGSREAEVALHADVRSRLRG